jgi:hypothetical protein
MKSFKHYITESKRVYEFKIKVAGDCPKDAVAKIKEALTVYKVESCSNGKGVPITEKLVDFPQLENVGVTIFDVCLSYPANTVQVREAVANKLKIVPASIRVRNMHEEQELEINHEHDDKSGESLLTKDYENNDGQQLVGDAHTMSLLKELGKHRTTGTPVKGTNDALLAKSAPVEKKQGPAKAAKVNVKSPVGNKKVKLTPVKVKGQ